MEKLEQYRNCVEKLIYQYGQYKPSYGEVEVQMVLDKKNDHYHLLTVGWDNNERIRGTILHIDIRDGKIWIQHDGTEAGVANELVKMGVPKEAIVLAFYALYRRQFTEFAVA